MEPSEQKAQAAQPVTATGRTTPAAITTPDEVETRLGALHFADGMPSPEALEDVYDHLDYTHAYQAFVGGLPWVNAHAMWRGLLEAGVKDNEFIVFPLLHAKSRILTANADTPFTFGFVDLSEGPMVLEAPPRVMGAVNDHCGAWVIDIGGSGPDRGAGGRYLLVPPGYQGSLPEGGFYVARPRTSRVMAFGRVFLDGDDPATATRRLCDQFKVYPYVDGGIGTSFASFLHGDAPLGPLAPPPETVFHDGDVMAMDGIPPTDFTFYEYLDEIVQQEPLGALDPELMGHLAAIGIVKGRSFAPDDRMKGILGEAVAVANATARSLWMRPRDPSPYCYPDSAWRLLEITTAGYDFETPPPVIEGPVRDGVRSPEKVITAPPTGYRALDARTALYYGGVGVSPASAMLVSGIGAQYIVAMVDAEGQYVDGGRTYRLTLPKDIPAARFWSLTVYDSQTRSMLDTPQRYPRAGSQSYPSPAAEAGADGSTPVYFAPQQPDGVGRGNWIQTLPGRGWFVMLRLYSPLEPFFEKTWRPGEIELVG
jgi:hypothetical protein